MSQLEINSYLQDVEIEKAYSFFQKRVNEYAPMNEMEFDVLKSAFSDLVQLKAKTTLLRPGENAKKCYFIIKGSMRFFYQKDGREITGNLFTEGMFVTSHDSWLEQIPSKTAIQTIEPTWALEASIGPFKEGMKRAPVIRDLTLAVLSDRLSFAHTTISRLVTMNHEQLYACLLEEQPDWIARFPDKILASYLGISATSLSRIKKRLIL